MHSRANMEESMMASLSQRLKEQNSSGRARLGPDVLSVIDEATAHLASSGLVEASLNVGAMAPDFSLPVATGAMISLSSLLIKGPVVLTFYRGGWCPYCSTELRALQAKLPEITAAGATLVAISPQTPDNSISTAEKFELAFPVLSDQGNAVAESFGLVFSLPESLRELYRGFGYDLPAVNGDSTFRLPLAATYVIDSDGVIAWRFADADYTKRAEPDDVIAILEALR
ncbi:MAG TPA: peroxiredoxin-like family protein [Acidimicrobiales bacterium]|nr:peroxiredoxin-like family protein [Acidimicrobiales bacterium]